jgi:hypothetical protein
MLLEFSVKNFLSFKDEVTLSLYAFPEVTGHEQYNLISMGGQHILKTAVIYGANASGKSNLIKAMGFMRHFVVNSLERKREKHREIDIESFKFNTDTINAPSEFEIVFVHQDIYYRYGFTLDKKRIHREWLYHAPAENEIQLFERTFEKGIYTVNLDETFKEGEPALEKQATREDALLLAVVSESFNGEISRTVMDWFTDDLNVLFATQEETFKGFTYKKLEDSSFKHEIKTFLEVADTAIEDIELVKVTEEDIPKSLPEGLRKLFSNANMVATKHTVRDASGNVMGAVSLDLNQESEGTQKLFALSGPIIETLRNGETLIVDELDSKLHPIMMRFIINLFNSPKSNPHHAQLIFATHDTNLLSPRFFRKDQLWFTEKDLYGTTDLYSLADYQLADDLTEEDAYKRDYFQGKYGAVPFIGEFNLFSGESNGKR